MAKKRKSITEAKVETTGVPLQKKDAKPAAYVIDLRAPGYNDTVKHVAFIDGVGILSDEIIAINRPDWYKNGAQIPGVGVKIEEYIEKWRDKGATISPLSADEVKAAASRIAKGEWRVKSTPQKPKPKVNLEEGADD